MARRCTRVTVDNSRSDTELSLDIVLQQPLNFPELTEHNCLLTLGLDDVELIEEPIELRCFLTVLLQRLRFKNPQAGRMRVCANQPQVVQQPEVVLKRRDTLLISPLFEVLDSLGIQVTLHHGQPQIATLLYDNLWKEVCGNIGLQAPENLRADASA